MAVSGPNCPIWPVRLLEVNKENLSTSCNLLAGTNLCFQVRGSKPGNAAAILDDIMEDPPLYRPIWWLDGYTLCHLADKLKLPSPCYPIKIKENFFSEQGDVSRLKTNMDEINWSQPYDQKRIYSYMYIKSFLSFLHFVIGTIN